MAKLRKQLKRVVTDAVRMSFSGGRIDEQKITKVIKMLKSLPLSDAIVTLSAYQNVIARELARTTLLIESAASLSGIEIDQIKVRLDQEFAIDRVEDKLDSSLMGGVKIKIGDYIYEDSIKSRINQVKEVLIA